MKKEKSFNTKSIKKTAAIASVFALAAGGFAYSTPTSYVSLDVNPSVEYSINMFDRVLSVQAVNEDAEEIVAELDIKNLVISDAVQKTIDKLLEEGFISDSEDAGVVITVSSEDEEKSEELAEDIEIEAQEFLTEQAENADVEAEAVGKARVEEARELGVTPGKLNLVEKLIASYGDTKEDYSDEEIRKFLELSVQEINKTIKKNRKSLATEEIEDDASITESATTAETADDTDLTEDNAKDKQEKSTNEKQQNENKQIKENKGLNKANKADDSDVEDDEQSDDTDDDNDSDSIKSENAKNKN